MNRLIRAAGSERGRDQITEALRVKIIDLSFFKKRRL